LYGVHESAYYVKDNTFTSCITYTQFCYKKLNYKITQSHYKPHKTVLKKNSKLQDNTFTCNFIFNLIDVFV